MLGHLKKTIYNKEMKISAERDYSTRLLDKEELGIILIFTVIVMAALLITYVL